MDDYSPVGALQMQPVGLASDPYEDVWPDPYLEDSMIDNPANQTRHDWDNAAYLAQMAIFVTIGIKKRLRGLRLFQLETRPSLLELAPAIWNAHYLKVGWFPSIKSQVYI